MAKRAPKAKTTRRLQPGEWRSVRVYDPTPTRPSYLAVTQFCDPVRCAVSQRSATGPTKPKARRALEDNLAAEAGHAAEIDARTPLRVLADEMLAEKRAKVATAEMSPGSLRVYRGHWRRYIEPVLGDVPVEWLTTRRCDQFLKTLRKTRGYATVKGVRSVLTEIAEVAVLGEVLDRNPVKNAADIPGGATKQVQALDPSEAADLWQKSIALSQGVLVDKHGDSLPACHRDVPDLVLWMLSTGDRIGNALAVHWPWIELDAVPVTAKLGPNLIRVEGEGLRLSEDTSKSRRSKLGLPGQCVEMLRVRRTRAVNLAGPVFCDSFGGLRDPSNTSRQLKAAFRAVGYGHITPHWFRKTVGSELDRAGLPTSEVAAQLRHADQRTTEKHYMEKRAVNPRATDAIEAMLSTRPERKVVGLHDADGAPGRGPE